MIRKSLRAGDVGRALVVKIRRIPPGCRLRAGMTAAERVRSAMRSTSFRPLVAAVLSQCQRIALRLVSESPRSPTMAAIRFSWSRWLIPLCTGEAKRTKSGLPPTGWRLGTAIAPGGSDYVEASSVRISHHCSVAVHRCGCK